MYYLNHATRERAPRGRPDRAGWLPLCVRTDSRVEVCAKPVPTLVEPHTSFDRAVCAQRKEPNPGGAARDAPRTSREQGPHFRIRLYTGQYNKERALPVPVFGKSTRELNGHAEDNLGFTRCTYATCEKC